MSFYGLKENSPWLHLIQEVIFILATKKDNSLHNKKKGNTNI